MKDKDMKDNAISADNIIINSKIKSFWIKLLVLCFWIFVWSLLSRIINQELFLPSPKSVLLAVLTLSKVAGFWISIANSFIRIISGFVLGLIIGAMIATLSYKSKIIYELISPLMKVIKATPVASFIILALVWISSVNLSVLVAFLMVLPISFSNILHGLKSTDEKLLEMAKVFHIGRLKRIKAIYYPAVTPFIISAISIGLGFSFKSGIAAEVIGRPANSIGLNLYEAKLYFMIKELFAWTVVVILLSVLFERLVMRILRCYGHIQSRV
ncbi:MAG: ABC transporter permease subunit [Anaerolineaceae bacterium]|nr:MAG: ABC transporter permease subunit [Anaerolineaceae bacterium]